MTDTLVILKAVSTSRKLAKTHTADAAGGWVSSGQIQMPFHFKFEVKETKGIDDLSHILKSLEHDPSLCVIRGEPTNATRASQTPVRRQKANFPPAPRRWVMLDIDAGIELANADWLANPGPAIKQAIIDYLPSCFHDTCCHWQLSSSAGVKNQTTLKAHLWFWFDRPIDDKDLKAWVRAARMPVDTALFSAVQLPASSYVKRSVTLRRHAKRSGQRQKGGHTFRRSRSSSLSALLPASLRGPRSLSMRGLSRLATAWRPLRAGSRNGKSLLLFGPSMATPGRWRHFGAPLRSSSGHRNAGSLLEAMLDCAVCVVARY